MAIKQNLLAPQNRAKAVTATKKVAPNAATDIAEETETAEEKAERENLAAAHAEIQSDHSKASFGYVLAEIRKLQKGNK